MLLDRFYYERLNSNERKIYRVIYDGIVKFDSNIRIPKMNNVALKNIIESIVYDNPHLYYVDMSFYEYVETIAHTIVRFNYAYDKKDKQLYQQKIESELRRILNIVNAKAKDNYTRIMTIHDYLCTHIRYCKTENSLRQHTVIGALIDKVAVCDGYSRAFKYLCNALNVKCIVAIGKEIKDGMDDHAWNIVDIDGCVCHIDVTWDSNISENDNPSRFYFGLCDETIRKDHIPGKDYPVSNNKNCDYLFKAGSVLCSKKELETYIKRCIHAKKRIVDFRIDRQNSSKAFRSIVIELINDVYQMRGFAGKINCKMVDNQDACRLIIDYSNSYRF